jgi:hypothetical protein
LRVDGRVIVETKAGGPGWSRDRVAATQPRLPEKVIPIHEAQLLTYLRLSGLQVGLLLNFNVALMKDGVKRYVHRASSS